MSGKRKVGIETMIALVLSGVLIIASIVETLSEFPLLFTITGFAAVGFIVFVVWYVKREKAIDERKDKEIKKK